MNKIENKHDDVTDLSENKELADFNCLACFSQADAKSCQVWSSFVLLSFSCFSASVSCVVCSL